MAHLKIGQFFGGVRARWKVPGAMVTHLEHTIGRRLPAHSHENPYVNLVLAGSYREETRTRKIEYAPGTLVMHPHGLEHRDEVGEGGAQFLLVEFQEIAPDWHPDFDREGGEAVWAAYRLAACHDAGLEMEEGVAELEAALAGRRRGVMAETAKPGWLGRVEDRLRHEYVDPPSLKTLAAEAHVHPVHLSRTWRRHRGMGLGEFVTRLRVAEAARQMALRGPATKAAEVALDLGFADQSHLARMFKRVTGMTVSEFRRLPGVLGARAAA